MNWCLTSGVISIPCPFFKTNRFQTPLSLREYKRTPRLRVIMHHLCASSETRSWMRFIVGLSRCQPSWIIPDIVFTFSMEQPYLQAPSIESAVIAGVRRDDTGTHDLLWKPWNAKHFKFQKSSAGVTGKLSNFSTDILWNTWMTNPLHSPLHLSQEPFLQRINTF
jgi:hypothetical protein